MLGFFKTAKREMIEQVRAESHEQGHQEGRAEVIRELKANPSIVHDILNGNGKAPTS